MDRVLALADRLRVEGLDARLDQYEISPPEGWPRWMRGQIETADFVLVVCTETYARRFEGKEEAGKGRGVDWEGMLLIQQLYGARGNRRLVPVTFSAAAEHVPLVLRGATGYQLDRDYERLYRHLSGQPETPLPPLGERRRLPPRERRQDFAGERSGADPVHNLPYRTLGSLFHGRGALLEALAAGSGEPTAIVQPGVIHGLGGIGKSRLAVEYAWRYRRRFPDGVFFVSGETPERLEAELAALAGPRCLALPEQESRDQAVVVAAVLRRLRRHSAWLLILDNADDGAAAGAVEELLPQLDQGRVLITSRWTSWGREIHEQPLDVLESEAACCYLLEAAARRSRRDDDKVQAGRLAERLGGLPLALELAASYVDRHRSSFGEYLAAWQEERSRVLEWYDPKRMHYPASMAATWQRSVAELSPGARCLLRLASFLAPDPIPRAVFEHGAATLDELGEEAGKVECREALAELGDYSLVGGEGSMWTVHRMVQEVVRSRIPEESRRRWLTWALAAVDAAAQGDPMDVRTWRVWDPLRPHVERIAETAVGAGIAEPTAWLLDRVAALLRTKALYRLAEPLSRRAVEIDRRAPYLNNLALLLYDTNQLEEAEKLYGEVLELEPDDGTCLNNLAQLLQATNRPGEAEPLMRRALEIDQVAFGGEHPKVAIRLNNLAALLRNTNRLGEAEPPMRRALGIDEVAFGGEHPRVAIDLNNLAQLLQDTNRLEEAEPLMRRALAIDEAAFGGEHPKVAIRLNNLARLLKATDRLGEAEPLMRRALEIFKASLGPDHPSTVTVRGNLAAMQGDKDILGPEKR